MADLQAVSADGGTKNTILYLTSVLAMKTQDCDIQFLVSKDMRVFVLVRKAEVGTGRLALV